MTTIPINFVFYSGDPTLHCEVYHFTKLIIDQSFSGKLFFTDAENLHKFSITYVLSMLSIPQNKPLRDFIYTNYPELLI